MSGTSAVFNASFPEYDQRRWWDSSKYPYGAVSGKLTSIGKVALHDFGLGIRLDRDGQTAFAFKDSGNDDYALGEVSLKVHKNLGGRGKGDNNYSVAYIVFPESSGGRSTNAGEFQSKVKDLLGALAAADNAEQLIMLIAFCADAGKSRAGLPLLEAFRQGKRGLPSSRNLKHVLAGLRALGWPATVGADLEQRAREAEMRSYMESRQLQSDGKVGLA